MTPSAPGRQHRSRNCNCGSGHRDGGSGPGAAHCLRKGCSVPRGVGVLGT